MRISIFVVCLLVVCTFIFTRPALAIDGIYVSGNVGAVMLRHSDVKVDELGTAKIRYDTGYAFTAAVGRKVEYVRFEGELSYRASDMKDEHYSYSDDSISVSASAGGDVETTSLMLNTYFDIDTGTRFTPFIGGGIGAAYINAKIWAKGTVEEDGEVWHESESADDYDIVFAYQGIVGIAFSLSDDTALDFSYRYFATSDPEFDGGVEGEYAGHNLMLGLRYSF